MASLKAGKEYVRVCLSQGADKLEAAVYFENNPSRDYVIPIKSVVKVSRGKKQLSLIEFKRIYQKPDRYGKIAGIIRDINGRKIEVFVDPGYITNKSKLVYLLGGPPDSKKKGDNKKTPPRVQPKVQPKKTPSMPKPTKPKTYHLTVRLDAEHAFQKRKVSFDDNYTQTCFIHSADFIKIGKGKEGLVKIILAEGKRLPSNPEAPVEIKIDSYGARNDFYTVRRKHILNPDK